MMRAGVPHAHLIYMYTGLVLPKQQGTVLPLQLWVCNATI